MASVPLRVQLERMTAERDFWKQAHAELAAVIQPESPTRAKLLVNVSRLRECLAMLNARFTWGSNETTRGHINALLDATKWAKDIT